MTENTLSSDVFRVHQSSGRLGNVSHCIDTFAVVPPFSLQAPSFRITTPTLFSSALSFHRR